MDKRPELYQRMADLTLPECTNVCNPPLSCCDPLYCQMAKDFAMEYYGIDLPEVGYHPSLPFMSENGCVVSPHLRPICTIHVCSISGLGFKKGDPEFDRRYFALRDQLNEAEGEALG